MPLSCDVLRNGAGVSRTRASETRIAVLQLLLAAAFFAVMALLTKRATLRLPGPEVALMRFLFGLVAVLVLALRKPLRIYNLKGLVLRGAFGGLAVLLYFLTIEHLAVGMATLLNYTAPVFSALWAALFLKEPLTLRVGLSLATTLVGVGLVAFGSGASASGAGVWYAVGLASAVISGAAVAAIRNVRKTDGPVEIFAAFCVGGALVTGPSALSHFVVPSAIDWFLLLGVGLTSVIAQLAMTHAFRFVSAAVGGLIMQTTPVFALLFGTVLFHERLSGISVFGAIITLLGVISAARR